MTKAETLKAVRLTHLYFGVFITPALLFFALTGALQTFGLHESNRDHPDYKPARWIMVLAQIHKKQTPVLPVKRGPAPGGAPAPAASGPTPGGAAAPVASPEPGSEAAGQGRTHRARTEAEAGKAAAPATPGAAPVAGAGNGAATAAGPAQGSQHHPLPLRIFFLVVSIGLFISSVTGLYMSYAYTRNKTLVTVALVLGIVLPLLLVAM